jgi:hypothetical protein
MRLTLGLRTPLVFHSTAPEIIDWREVPPEAVGIEFEGREFVWHPPMEREDEMGRSDYGPMVAVVYSEEADRQAAAAVLQRFLSAIAFVHEEVVDDAGASGLGGDGESDPYHPFGARMQRSHAVLHVAEAPAALIVVDDPVLRVALSYYREGLNASSPFYRCVAFRNVLDAVYGVEHETHGRSRIPTPEAAARDAFIDAAAAGASFGQAPMPQKGWARYLRDEVRNALAHVKRTGRREVYPDDLPERVRLIGDARVMQRLARTAIHQRWQNAVRQVAR